MALTLLGCGIAFQDVGNGDVKHRVVLCLLPPFVVAVNVREGCHFPAIQNHQPVIELTFASCGNKGVALRLAWTHIAGLEMVILDAVAGLRVVGDDFPACGGTPKTNPPTLVGVENPPSAAIVCHGDTFTFKLDQALADNGGIFLVIEASEGQSNGVSRAHSKAAAIKMVEEPTATAINIRADYVAKNGAPSAAAPKIFFRYYYVNSSTGEKSGVMLAETTWTAEPKPPTDQFRSQDEPSLQRCREGFSCVCQNFVVSLCRQIEI